MDLFFNFWIGHHFHCLKCKGYKGVFKLKTFPLSHVSSHPVSLWVNDVTHCLCLLDKVQSSLPSALALYFPGCAEFSSSKCPALCHLLPSPCFYLAKCFSSGWLQQVCDAGVQWVPRLSSPHLNLLPLNLIPCLPMFILRRLWTSWDLRLYSLLKTSPRQGGDKAALLSLGSLSGISEPPTSGSSGIHVCQPRPNSQGCLHHHAPPHGAPNSNARRMCFLRAAWRRRPTDTQQPGGGCLPAQAPLGGRGALALQRQKLVGRQRCFSWGGDNTAECYHHQSLPWVQ